MTTPKLLLLFLVIYSRSFGQQTGPQKYALIVAIGDYPVEKGWPKISSVRDAGYLHRVLADQGFPDKNITTLTDGAATIGGIKDAFSSLTAQIHPGDIVLVHFSCHGEQVEADNDNKIDGLDECVVTYNALSPFKSTDFQKDQAEYLRGHVLGSYLRALRAKLGRNGDLVVFMDDCHSGDGTRGLAKVRGGDPPFVSAHFEPGKHVRSDSSMISRDESQNGVNGADLASYEVFSATRPEELDIETTDDKTGVGIGSLTYAVCQAFVSLSAGSAHPSYRELFARIQSVMNIKVPQQHPLLEGTGIDRLLFGGQFVHQQPYIGISDIDKDTHQITLRQGTLAGLDKGSQIAVYPAGTRDTAARKPLATGKVDSAGSFSATATLDGPLAIDQPVDGWVFVTGRVYNVDPINLQLKMGATAAAEVRTSLADLPIVAFGPNPVLTLVRGPQADTLKVSANGYVFATVRNVAELKTKLQAYAQYTFLQSLKGEVPGVQVEVRLLLLKNGRPDTAATQLRMKGGLLETYNKDRLALLVRNTGTKDAYVNILDLQPDGIINSVLPKRAMAYPIPPQDLKIPAGGEYWLPAGDHIDISPPYGTEVFKVFACESEIDVESLASTTRGGGKAVMTAIEQMIRNSYGMSRGAIPSSGNADATTSEYIFLIKPKP